MLSSIFANASGSIPKWLPGIPSLHRFQHWCCLHKANFFLKPSIFLWIGMRLKMLRHLSIYSKYWNTIMSLLRMLPKKTLIQQSSVICFPPANSIPTIDSLHMTSQTASHRDGSDMAPRMTSLIIFLAEGSLLPWRKENSAKVPALPAVLVPC